MSAFKDLLQDDINNVFLNQNEFAEMHTVDGRQLLVVVDNDRLMQRSKKEFDGVSVGEILYYVQIKDLLERPEQGSLQVFDGRPMYVFDCREDGGIYEIILQQNRGM